MHSSYEMKLSRRALLAALAMPALSFGMSAGARAASWQDTIAAAETEGSVVVIAPPVPTHRATLELFRTAYPKIDLKISGLTASEFEPRVDAERKAGVYAWDVMVPGAQPTTYTTYIPQHWIVPIRDVILPENAQNDLWLAEFDASFIDAEKKYVFAFAAAHSNFMYVNRSVIPEAQLKSIEDLLKPEFKGRIVMFDPRVGGPGGSLAALLVLTLGKDRAAQFFRDQNITFSTTPRQLAEWVISGQYPIALALVDRDLVPYQQRGLAKDVKPLPAPHTIVNPQWAVVNLFNNAPHPNAAKVFINWLLSKDAQSDWAIRSGENSRRLDAAKGDPISLVDAEGWINGIDFSAQSQLQARLDTAAMLKEALK